MITTQTYVRKPLYVQAVQVTAENFNEIAQWCQGEIQEVMERNKTVQFIAVRVTSPMNPRQSQARVGDWILTSERGYKVYTPKAFEKAFDPHEETGNGVQTHGAAITMTQIEPRGYTAEQLQEMFGDKSLDSTPLSTAPDATRDSRVENHAVGTGPMPEQPLPGDVEEPAIAQSAPAHLIENDQNVVYPETPETTA